LQLIQMKDQITIHDALIDYEVIRRNVKNARIEYRNSELKVIVPKAHPDPHELVQRHRRWIYNRHAHMKNVHSFAEKLELVHSRCEDEFTTFVNTLVKKIGNDIGAIPQKVRFRKMKTKWGSCSSKGNINFNSHMRQLPDEMIEYIVYHEMVHLIELNHSPRFWKHIKLRYPDYKKKKKELSGYWHLLQKNNP